MNRKLGPRGGGLNNHLLGCMIPVEWVAELDELAKSQQRTRAEMVRSMLRRALGK